MSEPLFDDRPVLCAECGLRVVDGQCPLGHEGPVRFDGATYDEALDKPRLAGQLGAVYDVMSSGRWYTLGELALEVTNLLGSHASEASVSARIRDLRKERFGSHTMERKRDEQKVGLWLYRMVPR